MLEKGVAATVGPVAEPYLESFPAPEAFFGCLLDGGALVECYMVSNPFWSWRMVLIGDPLYRPFRPLLERRTRSRALVGESDLLYCIRCRYVRILKGLR